MTNPTGPWCWRDGELCEHNLSDAPHVMRDVCSGIGGECRQGSGFSSTRILDVKLMKYGGAEHDFMDIEESRQIDKKILDALTAHIFNEANRLFITGDRLGTLAIPGALPMSGNSAATPQSEPTGTEIMDAVTAAFERLKENPIVKAIWFVDCPDQRARFDSIMRRALFKETQVQSEYSAAFGIPLFDWDSTADYKDVARYKGLNESDAERLKKKDLADQILAGRWFILMSGVWAEMSDGRHRRVEL